MVALPTRNEEESIADVITALKVAGLKDIFVIDARSTDRTVALAEEAGLRVFQRDGHGKGSGIQKALEVAAHAGGDYLVVVDCDMTYPAYDIPHLLTYIPAYDMVVGARDFRRISWSHRVVNYLHTGLINFLFGARLLDINSGMRVMRVDRFQSLLTAEGFDIEAQITTRALATGLSIKEAPIDFDGTRRKGVSKIHAHDTFIILARILYEFWHSKQWFGTRAGRLLSAIGSDGAASWRRQSRRWLAIALLLMTIFGPRLMSLGSVLTVDEPLWRDRGAAFMKALATFHFADTLVAGQPGVTTAWIIGLVLPWNSLPVHQGAIAVTTGVLLMLISYFLILLWGFRWGVVGGFFLALNPFLLAHSRVVHTDALMALFSLAALLALLVAMSNWQAYKKLPYRYLVASAVLMALAILTKVFAIVLFPVFLFVMAVYAWQARASWRIFWRTFFLWIGIVAVTAYVVWPALWLNSGALSYLTERSSMHAAGTRSEEITSAWWYYWREGFFRLTPVTALLAPLGFIGMWRGSKSVRREGVATVAGAGLIYALVLSVGSDKSDRYILFSLLTLDLIAVFGLYCLWQWIRGRERAGVLLLTTLLAAPILWLAIDVVRIHPYYLAHYNRFYLIEPTHKLGWGEGLEQAAAWISADRTDASVASYYPRVFNYFYPGGNVSAVHYDEGKDYVVLYRSMLERGPGSLETDILQRYAESGMPPVHIVYINGLPYAWIYKNSSH